MTNPTTLPLGDLDYPKAGQVSFGPEIAVAGWVIFPGLDVASVDVFLDGEKVANARTELPRPDVRNVYPEHKLSAGYAGFEASVSIPHFADGDTHRIHARATASDGQTWYTPEILVTLHEDHDLTDNVDNASDEELLPVGNLDLPVVGTMPFQSAIHATGWVLFPEGRIDYAEVLVDGKRVTGASIEHFRGDVGMMYPQFGLASGFSGFDAWFDVPEISDERTFRIQVRATAIDGRIWYSSEVGVSFTPQVEKKYYELQAPALFDVQVPKVGNKTRVTVFTHALSLGGGELYLQELLLRLCRRSDLDIFVIAAGGGPLREALEEAGAKVHVTSPYNYDTQHYAGRIAEIRMLLAAWGTQIVLVNTLGMSLPADAAIQSGLPVIWAIHESFELGVFELFMSNLKGFPPSLRQRFHSTLRNSELIYEADSTLELHNNRLPGLRARKVHYGINLEEIAQYRKIHNRDRLRTSLGFTSKNRVLLCMGVVQERKAQIRLLLSFMQNAMKYPDAILVFVGYQATPYSEALRDLAENSLISDRVRLIDISPDTFQWYHAADILVSAADIESLPRSILEAHAFGLPVVAADVFGVSEVVREGDTGWLFASRNSSAMNEAIARVLQLSDEEITQFRGRAFMASAAYDGANYAETYAEMIDEMLQNRTVNSLTKN